MASKQHGVKIAQGNIAAILDKLQEQSNATYNAVADEIELTALEIETSAKENVPVKTGRLRASITSIFQRDRLNAFVGTNVEYAQKVEYGENKRPAKPYLFPAFFENLPKLEQRLKKITE